mmetsp:Transcript_1391/g.3225  ORF Transcript_1391/g.3225 Transcript_1391/m.3225 type:complete len:379 (+) Transcript_1391:60-1196(+)
MTREFVEDAARFLEEHEVYFLLRDLMKDLIREQPKDPFPFLIEKLQAPKQVLLCMLSPPGLDGDKHAASVAESFDLTCVNVDAAVDQSTATADADAIACAKASLEKPAASKGVLLYGFPKTKVQARALQNMRKVPDSVCIISGDKKRITNALLQRAPGATAEEKADAVSSQVQIYQRHIHSVAEIFKNSVTEISITDQTKSVIDQVKHAVGRAVADPRGPLRMCVLGPLGSGRSTQAAKVAEDFGVVHVDVCAMMSGKPTEAFADEELCEKVGARLRQADCLRKGWVLDGFPQTEAQAVFLKKAHLWPSRVVHLTVPESTCLQRLSIRRVDPATGDYYYGQAPQLAVRQRLQQAKSDLPGAVSERYLKLPREFYTKIY